MTTIHRKARNAAYLAIAAHRAEQARAARAGDAEGRIMDALRSPGGRLGLPASVLAGYVSGTVPCTEAEALEHLRALRHRGKVMECADGTWAAVRL